MNSYLACAHRRDVYMFGNITLTFVLAGLLELTGLYVNEPPRKWVHAVLCTLTRNTSKKANFTASSIIKQFTRTSFATSSKCVLEVEVEGVASSQKMDRTYPSTSPGSLAYLHNSLSVSADWSKEKGFNLIGWLTRLEPIICCFRFSFVTLVEPDVCRSFWPCGLAFFFVLKRKNFCGSRWPKFRWFWGFLLHQLNNNKII